MIYIIGGAPRCGKTKLAQKLSLKLNIPIYSTDKLRIKKVKECPKNKINFMFPFEKMFNGDEVDKCFKEYTPEDFLNADKKEASSLFEEISYFIKNNLNEKRDYIIEGVHLLPHYINNLKLPSNKYRIIYLIKTNESKILHGLKLNRSKNDWIIGHIKKPITLTRASKMISLYGKYFIKESNKYGFVYINTEEKFFKKLKDYENIISNNNRKKKL